MAAETGTRPRGEGGGRGGGRQDFGGNGQDGGAGRGGSHHGSWAQVLGSTLPTSQNKNVLEIVLEKDEMKFLQRDSADMMFLRLLPLALEQ